MSKRDIWMAALNVAALVGLAALILLIGILARRVDAQQSGDLETYLGSIGVTFEEYGEGAMLNWGELPTDVAPSLNSLAVTLVEIETDSVEVRPGECVDGVRIDVRGADQEVLAQSTSCSGGIYTIEPALTLTDGTKTRLAIDWYDEMVLSRENYDPGGDFLVLDYNTAGTGAADTVRRSSLPDGKGSVNSWTLTGPGDTTPGRLILRTDGQTAFEKVRVVLYDGKGRVLGSGEAGAPNLTISADKRTATWLLQDVDADELAAQAGEVVVLRFEDGTFRVFMQRSPAGELGAQIALTIIAGVAFGIVAKKKGYRSPGLETIIVVAMSIGSLLLPIFGLGNLFWSGGILFLAAVIIVATNFLRSRA